MKDDCTRDYKTGVTGRHKIVGVDNSVDVTTTEEIFVHSTLTCQVESRQVKGHIKNDEDLIKEFIVILN